MRTKLIKVHTVKSQLIVQFDKFNGHTSVAISCLRPHSNLKTLIDGTIKITITHSLRVNHHLKVMRHACLHSHAGWHLSVPPSTLARYQFYTFVWRGYAFWKHVSIPRDQNPSPSLKKHMR